MSSSCILYELNPGVDTEDVYDRLSSGLTIREDGNEVDTLITDVGNLERTERGLGFVGRFDIEEQRPVRDKEDTWFPALHKVTVRLTNQYFILNGFNSRAKASSYVADIIGLDDDEYEPVEFSSAAVLGLAAEDAAELSQGTWDDPTEHADTATVWGELEDSSLYTEFNAEGQPSWVRFETESHPGREAGISTNKNSVFFGSGWDISEMEDYIFEKVIPNTAD